MRGEHVSDAAAPAFALLERRVAFAQAAALARVGLEAILIGTCVGTVVLGVARLEAPGSATSPALLAASFAALGWWLERRPTRVETVRRIDRRCGLDGGFVTWSECGGAPARRFGELLARRIDARLPRSAIVRAAAPAHPGMLALPCLAIAFYLWTRSDASEIEPRPAPGSARMASAALDRLDARARAAIQDRTGNLEANAQLVELASELRRLSKAGVADRTGTIAHSTAEELASLLARGRALERDERLDPDLRSTLNDVLHELRSAAQTSDLASKDPTASSSASATRSDASAGGSRSTNSDSEGQQPTTVGQAGALPSEPRGVGVTPGVAVPATTAGKPARGVSSAGTWWSPRYDAVVERWVEARRGPR